MSWSPNSWQQKPNFQAIAYKCEASLQQVIELLSQQPNLVKLAEIEALKRSLVDVQRGKHFILQGGNCVETFSDSNTASISGQLALLAKLSAVLEQGLAKSIVTIGRLAGQYAKPRSAQTEWHNDLELLSYRGDLINSIEANDQARMPDPKRLLQGYGCASKALADIQTYMLTEVGSIYVSHEALHLPYEQALTRKVNGRWYNMATHFTWVGARTSQLEGAQVEYIRGLANPIGIKIDPSISAKQLAELIALLNPQDEPGRLVLIYRLGVTQIEDKLPKLIEAAKNRAVIWMVDPMHGNTKRTVNNIKTRYFKDIIREIGLAVKIHQTMQTYLGGIHLELTAEEVTECIGGASGITERDLTIAYKTLIDPRLNSQQSLELVLKLIDCLKPG